MVKNDQSAHENKGKGLGEPSKTTRDAASYVKGGRGLRGKNSVKVR